MNKQLLKRILFAFASLAGGIALAVSTAAAAQQGGRVTRDEFFIISSVNVPEHSMVLKLPTEVTRTMKITDKTSIIGEKGQPIKVDRLRSGDTVYITYVTNAHGDVATKIRIGPMTVKVLHERYLKGYAVPVPPPQPPRVLSNKKSNGKGQQGSTH